MTNFSKKPSTAMDLVYWAFVKQKAGNCLDSEAVEGWGGPVNKMRSSWGQFQWMASLGVKVDCPSKQHDHYHDEVHPDAMVIVRAVKEMDKDLAAVLLGCVRGAGEPDAMWGVEPRQVPVRKANGKVKGVWVNGNRIGTMMAWENGISPEAVRYARKQWKMWADAVAQFESLCGQMQGYELTPMKTIRRAG